MNSAKFMALCFGLMTLITVSVIPILSVFSAMLCAGTGWCSINKGIDNKGYMFSAAVILAMAISVGWKIQYPW